jgi:hypothetical protein
MEAEEGFLDSGSQTGIHRKSLPRLGKAATLPPLRIVDVAVVLFLPLPGGLDKLGPAEIITILALLSPEHDFNDSLGRNTRVVTS